MINVWSFGLGYSSQQRHHVDYSERYHAAQREKRRSVYRKQSQQKKHSTASNVVFRSLVVLALLFVLVQIGRSVITNGVKVVGLLAHHVELEKIHTETVDTKDKITRRIDFYNSNQGVEELARNELDMVGSNEVLVEFIR